MNREQLEEIRARAEKATPGAWYVVGPPWNSGTPWVNAGSPDPHQMSFVCDLDADMAGVEREDGAGNEPADAAFIAHARTDVPALLDEIDRLNIALGACRTALDHHLHVCTDTVARAVTPPSGTAPVSLGTECLRCRHSYNWHCNSNGWCVFVDDGSQCGCYFIAPTAEGSAEGGTSKVSSNHDDYRGFGGAL